MCRLCAIKTCSTGTSWPSKAGPIGYPKTLEWNYHFMLHTIPEDSRSQNLFNFNVSFSQNAKWWNIYICSVTLLQKMSTRVKSHDLPGQAIGPALPTQHLCSSFISSSIKTTIHEAFSFWYHINKIHTQINQLAVTAKDTFTVWHTVCVVSVAVQSWQTDFHGLHDRFPWLVLHSCLIWTHIILVICRRLEKYSRYIMLQWTGHPASV